MKKSILFLCTVLSIFSCNKQENGGDVHKWDSVVSDYFEISNSIINKDSFVFFSDPHLLSAMDSFSDDVKNNLVSSLFPIKEICNILPIQFCLCGGDWLNYGDSQLIASQKLLYADEKMKALVPCYYKMMGNHDTNYQGIVSNNDYSRGDLPRTFIDKEYFSETGSAYYSFFTSLTNFIVLDSGLDWDIQISDYRREQLLWLANQLFYNRREHIVIAVHMFFIDGYMPPMSSEIISICKAYNSRNEFEMDGMSFDYSDATGSVHCILSGHRHIDSVDYKSGIPIVGICNYMKDNIPSFDICLIDYDSGAIYTQRIGIGENRCIQLAI